MAVSIRAITPLAPWDLCGLAQPYARWSRDEADSRALHGGRRVWYTAGAFTEAITRGDARLLVDHRDELLLAHQDDGGLRFSETAGGLWFEATLDRGPLADLVIRGVADGTITGVCVRATCHPEETPDTIRVYRVIRFDVSLMVSQFSCWDETSVRVNRIHTQSLRQRKDRLYEALWATVPKPQAITESAPS